MGQLISVIAVLLIIFAALLYLIGVLWLLFGGAPPAWLITITDVLGAALATNFGALLGINLVETRLQEMSFWQRFVEFLRKIFKALSSFDKDTLPELAAALYFVVLVLGFIVYLIRPTDTGLAHDLAFGLIGAAIAIFIHYLRKPS